MQGGFFRGRRQTDDGSRPPWETAPRRVTPVGTVLLIFAVLILGTAFAIRVANTVMGADGNSPSVPSFFMSPKESEKPAGLLLKRAPTNANVSLSLSPTAEKSLTFQEIYQKAIPSVVGVEGSDYSGTGIIISQDGYIITNYHVVAGNSDVQICLQDQSRYEARLVGGDQQNDLVVLKIDASGLTPAEFGDSSKLLVGDKVVAIGNPLGIELRGTMTDGIISAINRDVSVEGRIMTLIQTNAALNAGNSGGPLLNENGQVIGINTMKMSSYDSSVEGLGFAIPISSAKPIVDQLLKNGLVTGYPALGITVSAFTRMDATDLNMPAGVYVESVDVHSDAYTQGLRPGDVITTANGKKVTTPADLNAVKSGLAVGDRMVLTVYQNGTYKTITVTLIDKSALEDK